MSTAATYSFNHGVRSRQVPPTVIPATVPEVGIAGLIGTAPIHLAANPAAVNTPILVIGLADAIDKFGPDRVGYTLPKAFIEIDEECGGEWAAIVVNVFDPANDLTTVTGQTFTFGVGNTLDLGEANIDLLAVVGDAQYIGDYRLPVGGKAIGTENATISTVKTLAGVTLTATTDYTISGNIITPVTVTDQIVRVTYSEPNTTFSAGTDYTVNHATGIVARVIGGRIAAEDSVNIDFSYPTAPSNADLVGAVSGDQKTGMQALQDAFGIYGEIPYELGVPEYSDRPEIQDALLALAYKLEAQAHCCAPTDSSSDQLLQGRGGTGDLAHWLEKDIRLSLYGGSQTDYRQHTDAIESTDLSTRAIAASLRTTRELGFWYSSSNKPLSIISATVFDNSGETSIVNQLNKDGVTVINRFRSTGFVLWGNSNSARSSSAAASLMHFRSVVRTADVIARQLRQAMLPYIDRPLALSDVEAQTGVVLLMREAGQFILNSFTGSAITEGVFKIDAAKNPRETLAVGRVLCTYEIVPVVPLEDVILEQSVVPRLSFDLEL